MLFRLKYSDYSLDIGINTSIIFLIILFTVTAAIISINYLFYGIAALLLCILVSIYGERMLIALLIISLFILVSDLGATIRLSVQILNSLLLGVLFLKRYGFNFVEYPRLPKPLIGFLLVYYSSMIITTIFSDHFFAGIEMISRQTIFFIMVYIFFSLIRDQNYVRFYIIALVITSLILASSSIVKFVEGGSSLLDVFLGIRLRVSSIISNADTTTAFFLLTLPIALVFLFDDKFKKQRVLYLFVSLVIIIGLFLVMSRSAVLALIFSTLFILYNLDKKWFERSVIIVVLAVIMFIVISPLNNIVLILFRVEEGLSERDHLWNLAFNILNNHWLLGLGPGSYKYEVFNYLPVLLSSWVGHYIIDLNIATSGANASHSIYLYFFTDMGIPGLVTIIYLIVLCAKTSTHTIKKSRQGKREMYLIILSISAVLCSMFIRNIFDSVGILTYGYITNDLPFWLLFSILIYYYQKPQEYFLESEEIKASSRNLPANE